LNSNLNMTEFNSGASNTWRSSESYKPPMARFREKL
jgi:hypothetical protein